MRKLINNKKFSLALTLLLGALVIASFAIPELADGILSFIGISGGAGLGGTVLATTVTGPVSVKQTESASTTHLGRDVSDIITFKRPDMNPLYTLVSRVAKKKQVRNFKAEWEEVSVRGGEDTLTALFTPAGSAADESVTLNVTNTEIWNAYDTLVVDEASGEHVLGGDGNPVVLFVKSVDEDNDQIVVTAINGSNSSGAGSRVPALESGCKLYRMAPASHELQAQIGEKYQIPTQDYNYCQTFQKQLSEGILESKHYAYSGYDFKDKKELAIWDHKSSIEKEFIRGVRSKKEQTVNGETNYVYTCDGVYNKISNSLTYGPGSGSTAITVNDVIDIMEQVFAPNMGSEKRYLLAGSTLMGALNKIDTSNRRLKSEDEEVVIGYKTQKLVTNFGELVLVHSKTMDTFGTAWKKKGIILDFDHIVQAQLEAPTVTPLELNKSGQKKVKNAYRLDETCCLQLRYAGAGGVHAVIDPDPTT